MDQALWRRIERAELLCGTGTLADTLAAETALDDEQVAVTLREYRRFLYLAATSDPTPAPPPLLEHVWRLHAADPRGRASLAEALGSRMPRDTDAGRKKADRGAYARTLALYRDTFGEAPPRGVWPSPTMLAYHGWAIAAFGIGMTFGFVTLASGAWLAAAAWLAAGFAALVWYRRRGPWAWAIAGSEAPNGGP